LNHYLHSLYYFSDNDNYTFGRADLFRSAYYRQLSNYVTAFAGFNNRWSSFLKSRAGLRYNHFSQHKGGGLTYYLQVKCRLHEKLLFYCMTNTELRPINVVNIFNREQALYVDADNVSELWAPRMEQFQVGFKFSFNKHNILNFQYYKREYRVLARSSRYYPFGMKMEPDDPYEAASFRFGTVRGAEVRLSSHFVKWFQMNLHYQYNDGEYSDYSDMSGYNSLPAKYAHKHLGTLEGNMMLGPLRINVMYRYGSGLYYRDLSKSIIRSDGSLALLDHDSEYRSLPAYQRLDAHVEMNFILCGHALKLYGHGVNLLQNKNIKDYAWRTESGSWYSTETSIEKYTFTMMPRSYNIGIAIAK
ncbi:hypothetical protein KAR48_19820, partial [bacterium]|nr:hypothetical protein [bacterium]